MTDKLRVTLEFFDRDANTSSPYAEPIKKLGAIYWPMVGQEWATFAMQVSDAVGDAILNHENKLKEVK